MNTPLEETTILRDCPGSQEKYLFRLVKTAELCDKGEHEIIA
jgi:hypothetical protein